MIDSGTHLFLKTNYIISNHWIRIKLFIIISHGERGEPRVQFEKPYPAWARLFEWQQRLGLAQRIILLELGLVRRVILLELGLARRLILLELSSSQIQLLKLRFFFSSLFGLIDYKRKKKENELRMKKKSKEKYNFLSFSCIYLGRKKGFFF